MASPAILAMPGRRSLVSRRPDARRVGRLLPRRHAECRSSDTALALIASGDRQSAAKAPNIVDIAWRRPTRVRTPPGLCPGTPAMLAGHTSVAGSATAWRAIRRAVTPLQVRAAGVTDFTYVSKRTGASA